MKFGVAMENYNVDGSEKVKIETGSSNNMSAVDWDISSKFCTPIAQNLPKC